MGLFHVNLIACCIFFTDVLWKWKLKHLFKRSKLGLWDIWQPAFILTLKYLLTGLEKFYNDQHVTKQIGLSVLQRPLVAIVKHGKTNEQMSVMLLNVNAFGDDFNVNKMIANLENKLKVLFFTFSWQCDFKSILYETY